MMIGQEQQRVRTPKEIKILEVDPKIDAHYFRTAEISESVDAITEIYFVKICLRLNPDLPTNWTIHDTQFT